MHIILQQIAGMVRRGELIDKATRENVYQFTGYNDLDTESPDEYLQKLTNYVKAQIAPPAPIHHTIIPEKGIEMPGAPQNIPASRQELLKQHLEQLLAAISNVITDIYGTHVDKDFIEKQIMPRVLKTVARWVGSWITERVPRGIPSKGK